MDSRQRARLRPLTLAIFLSALVFAGCSKTNWLAQFYAFRAEQAFSKAYALRTKRKEIPYTKRLRLYRTACDYFWRAFEVDKRSFTLNRIDSAAESCLRVEEPGREKAFRQFEEDYIRKHPDEAEYGDAGAYMNIE